MVLADIYRSTIDTVFYMEYLISEMDSIYYNLKFFRSNHLAIYWKLDELLSRLYEIIINVYENIANAFVIARLSYCDNHQIAHSEDQRGTILIDKAPNDRTILLLNNVEKRIESIKRRILELRKNYNYVSSCGILDALENGEFILGIIKTPKFEIIVTTIRLFIRHKNSANFIFYYRSDIASIKSCKSLLFRGLIMQLRDGLKIKLPTNEKNGAQILKKIKRMLRTDTKSIMSAIEKIDQERSLIRPNIRTLKIEILKAIVSIKSNQSYLQSLR